MKIPIIPALMLVVLATLSAFGQASVVYSRTNYSVILPTNITAVRIGGQFITNPVGLNLTNRGGSVGVVDTLPTNTLPGLLSGLSVGNGGGVLTNTAVPVIILGTNNTGNVSYVTNPPGARYVRITGVARGGAGGSGRRGAAGSLRTGGGGGSGGQKSVAIYDLSQLWTNVFLYQHGSVSTLGTPGGAVTTDDSNGTNGVASANSILYLGNTTTTNRLMNISSGNPGLAGNNSGSAAGGTAAQIGGEFGGAAGGASSATGGAGATGTAAAAPNMGGTGGGAGGGITTGDVPAAGGNGGSHFLYFVTASWSNGGGVGASGIGVASGYEIPIWTRLNPWFGAGGGGAQTNAVAGSGGTGAGWGAGGGGGGASLNGYASGAGGNPGPGIFVFEYF